MTHAKANRARCPYLNNPTHQELPTMSTPSEAVEIYCVKCKTKTASKDIEAVTMKNGRPAVRSICVECGTKKFRIGVLP